MVCLSLPVQQEQLIDTNIMTRSIISNFILFQLGWFACVLGGANDQVVIGTLIATAVIANHLYRAHDRSKETVFLLLALIIGLIFESLVTALGLAVYSHGQVFDSIAPIWIILMWPLFATTLNVSMRWLKRMPTLAVAAIGAVFAPFAYYAGNRLGAVVYDDLLLSMCIIAIAWGLLFPLLVVMSSKLDGYMSTTFKHDQQERPQHV